MAEQDEYRRIGKFIYGAVRYGGGMADIHKWMSDDLNVQCPDADHGPAASALYQKFFAKYENDEAFEVNLHSFLEALKHRSS